MDINTRSKMVHAMEYIAQQINDEEVFEKWLVNGVADGDIPYGNFEYGCESYYEDDKDFADLMDTFLWVMTKACRSGGLYCDGVVSCAK